MQVGSGNESDQKAFVSMIKEFKSQWTGAAPSVYVMDAAFYTESNRLSSVSSDKHYLSLETEESQIVVANHRNQAGRFILATNLLDEERSLIAASNVVMPPEKWTNDLILKEYKDQQTTERGFRFIKDTLFFVSRVFLKSAKRIMALAMIMTLALMVYSLGQRQLRRALEITQSTLPNQKGQPTARPTLRWILQFFQSVHLIFVDGIKSRIQLTSRQTLILQFLSTSSRQYYFLS
jgi:transposase